MSEMSEDRISERIRAESDKKHESSLMLMHASRDTFDFLLETDQFDYTNEESRIFTGVVRFGEEVLEEDQAIEARFVAIKEPDGGYKLMNASYNRINLKTDEVDIMEDVICTENDEDFIPGPDHGHQSDDITFSLIAAIDELSKK